MLAVQLVLHILRGRMGPAILSLMNLLHSTGIVPSSFKVMVQKTLLKKPGLNPELVSNYRPISNLPFLLQLTGKTEQIINRLKTVPEKIGECLTVNVSQSASVRNLGVQFDPLLCFDQHLRSITRIAFFHLRNIAKIRPMLSAADAETMFHAFTSSRLDYCNSLFSGLPNSNAT